jgi:hypothetical protein
MVYQRVPTDQPGPQHFCDTYRDRRPNFSRNLR